MLRLALLLLAVVLMPAHAEDDPYLWLEEIEGDTALEWVRARNAEAEREFAADPRYDPLRAELLKILDSRARIPFVVRQGAHYYNFWRDERNPRGLWRRTPVAEYRRAEPEWQVLLDLDALAAAEKENWVWKGAECLRPDRPDDPWQRCMLSLSRGGADAVVLREFDLEAASFVDGGFALPEAKQWIDWKDRDTLWVGTDFGPGSLTTSGYPRIVKEWRRGTPLRDGRTIFSAEPADVGAWAWSDHETGRRRDWVQRSIAFWNSEKFVAVDGALVRVDVPADATVHVLRDWLLVRTRTPWQVGGATHPAGALLAARFDAFLRGERSLDVLYMPGARRSIDAIALTRHAVLLVELNNVRPRLWELRHDGRAWQRRRVEMPEFGRIGGLATHRDGDDYLLTHQDFATPTTLYGRTVGSPRSEALKALPPLFDATGLRTQQFEAVSRDGTRIPYFVARREASAHGGRNPTLLYGYGGFASTQLPWYSGVFGKGWFEPGGILVLANLRGGGEFGPQWHEAARRENKQRTWDDLAAVAEDLVGRGITEPRRLGIMGGSQGGLLVTAAMVQRPELFGAVVAQVPLTDMLRYHRLLAGASWIAEYGDPDVPEERAWLAKYSPYQNVRRDARYPRIFLTTSTRDDRVHPGHARKLAARMREMGHDVVYFENVEGGHGAAADNAQVARMWAQTFSFLWRQLGGE